MSSTVTTGSAVLYFSSLQFHLFVPVALIYSIAARLLIRAKETNPLDLIAPKTLAENKVAIVTGSNTGIGLETARSLVQSAQFSTVILACRSKDKGEAAALNIREDTTNDACNVVVLPLDLSNMSSVVQFSETIQERYGQQLYLLVNNAGCNVSGDPTEDGFERLFQTNFLGHFVLTLRLLKVMAPAGARIVNLSSVMHHFSGPVESTKEFWRNVALQPGGYQYQLSKLAAILFTMELTKRYPHVRSIAVNPGAVNSDIWRNFPGFVRSIFALIYINNAQGCRTTIAASLSESLPQDCIYLQPYWLPCVGRNKTPFPLFEMLGPFQGYRITQPRIPPSITSAGMWDAFAALTSQWLL